VADDGEAEAMRPTICLNMIVRDEAAVIERCLASVADVIDSWVIVDTGSADDTIELVMAFFGARAIPGEIHQREWVNFGANRSEALLLAQGKADYLLLIDADMTLNVHGPFKHDLEAASYLLGTEGGLDYLNVRLVRNDRRWEYVGATHEYVWSPEGGDQRDLPQLSVSHHADGGSRSDKFERDVALLEDRLDEEPDDVRAMFYLAQSYKDMGREAEALQWYERRASAGGWDEEVWYSLYQVARMQELAGAEWSSCLDAYLAAYHYRPSRAEPLYEIARYYREAERYDLAYLFADGANRVEYPLADKLFISRDIYQWRIADELAIASYWSGRYQKSFELCIELLDGPYLPDEHRARITQNRDYSVPLLKDALAEYPAATIARLTREDPSPEADVTVTVTSCRRRDLFETSMNSFLACCLDLDRIARWICIDDRSSEADRQRMRTRYPFFEFVMKEDDDAGHARSMNIARELVDTRYWIHLEDDWQFFVPDHYVAKAAAILEDDREIGQVVFNVNYGEMLESRDVVGGQIRHTKGGDLRYRLHEYYRRDSADWERFLEDLGPGQGTNAWYPHYSLQPSMTVAATMQVLGPFDEVSSYFEEDFARDEFTGAGLQTAFFDEVHSLHLGRLQGQSGDDTIPNAYVLNGQAQFGSIPGPTTIQDAGEFSVGVVGVDSGRYLNQSPVPGRWGDVSLAETGGSAEYFVVFNVEAAREAGIDLARAIVVGDAAIDVDEGDALQARRPDIFPPLMDWDPALEYEAAQAGIPDDGERYAVVEDDAELLAALMKGSLAFVRGNSQLAVWLDPLVFVPLPPAADAAAMEQTVDRARHEHLWDQRRDVIAGERLQIANDRQFFPALARLLPGAALFEQLGIRIVNLDRRPDRLERMQRSVAEAAGGRFLQRCQRVAAVDGRTLDLTPDVKALFTNNTFASRTAIMGNALSHIGLWRQLQESPEPAWLIFEDDVRLAPSFGSQLVELFGQLLERHPRFDLLFLGWTPLAEQAGGHGLDESQLATLRPVDWFAYRGGGFAYVISGKGATRLLALLERDGCRTPLDNFIQAHGGELEVLVADPPLAVSDTVDTPGGDSDIWHDERRL
jgi:GR25 family glycosyltransferase involved in LPS biosynthesis/glycosyltransferase involved in cell wall biosynthesis